MSQDGMELASKSSLGGEVRGSAAAVWLASVDIARFDRVVVAYGDYCVAVGAGAVSLGNFIGCESWSGAGSGLVAWDACFSQAVGPVGGSALDASVSGGDCCVGRGGRGAGARSCCGRGIESRCSECVVTSCRGLVSVGDEGSFGGACGRRDEGVDPRECDGSLSGCDGGGSLGKECEDALKVEEASGGVVGKQHRKNVRKRERVKARRLASAAAGASCSGLARVEGLGDVSSGDISADVEREGVGAPGAGHAVVLGRERGFGSGVATPSERGGFVKEDLKCAVSDEERRQLAREWYDRKRAENALATQRAKYNFKRNEYLDRARISEKKWEQERLTCEQKLARITEARFGSKPGYAETLASLSDGTERPPSLSTDGSSPANLSDGTVSPNSSMSVAEENRLKKKVEDLAGEVAQLKLERVALNAACKFSGGKAVVEDGRVHVYDGSGQYVPPTPVYGSECELYSMGDYPEELQYC